MDHKREDRTSPLARINLKGVGRRPDGWRSWLVDHKREDRTSPLARINLKGVGRQQH